MRTIRNLRLVARSVPGAEEKTSRRGVPYLLYRGPVHTVSCAWFGKTGWFRIFWPFMADPQRRVDRETPEEAADAMIAAGAGKDPA